MMTGRVAKTAGDRSARSAARLAAVQALYQHAVNPDLPVAELVDEYISHRLGKMVDGVLMADADANFFAEVVVGVDAQREKLDGLIAGALSEKWSLGRLEEVE